MGLKVPHKTTAFGSSSYHASRTGPELLATHTVPNLTTDTVTRSISSVYFSVSVDPSVNPPPRDWFHTARLVYFMQWNPGGSSTLTTNENDPTVIARWLLYPTQYDSTLTNGEYGVTFQPRSDTLVTTTRHKGDGVNNGKLLFGFFYHDSYGVFVNAGAGYSTTSSFVTYTRVFWESDS